MPLLNVAIEPLLRALEQLVTERKARDKLLGQAARKDKVCLRLMTIPGVGAITSLAFRVTVDDPARFDSSKAVGAFGWVNRARRLAKDFEALITSSQAWFMLSLAFLLIRRIARDYETAT